MYSNNGLYKSILVAIDLSKHSDIPMQKAIKLSLQYNAPLDVIHVISMAIPYYSYSFSTEVQDAVYADTKQYFISFCEKYHIPQDRQHLLIGSPKTQILDLIDKMKIDLLIVGGHGDQHILPASFGSTASSLIAKATCDVLTVSIHPAYQDEMDSANNTTNQREQNIVV
jgi:nucleotide-binding universal stress UspA family protein